jgi:iron(III) transport system substrate-binding protein
MISEPVQMLFPAGGGYGARIDVPPPAGAPALKDVKILPVDYEYIEKESGRIKRKFNEVFQ